LHHRIVGVQPNAIAKMPANISLGTWACRSSAPKSPPNG
jgi:hypothetical protein